MNIELTPDERYELDAWVWTRGSTDIDYVTIDPHVVAIHGGLGGQPPMSAIAARHPGRLTDSLDEALLTLRNTP